MGFDWWASMWAGLGGAGFVVALFMLLLRRFFVRVDAVSEELKIVKAKEIARLDARHTKAAEVRKTMHQEIATIQQTMVTRKEFKAHTDQAIGQMQTIARVTERVDITSRRTEQLFERVISAQSDIDKMIGRLEAIGGQS